MATRSANDAAKTIGVILNPRSGYVTRHGVEETCAQIQDAIPGARVHVLDPHDDITRCVQELISSGATTVAAAGGDGTVNAVATALAGSDAVHGVLPAGTLNHFAQDIGLGHGMRHALRALLTGRVKTIDVGSVNGNLFLNNSSIGVYPHLVQLRAQIKKQQPRALATLQAAILAAQKPGLSRISFSAFSETQTFHGSFLFVGNNRYGTAPFRGRGRQRLDEGVLSCLILDGPGPGQSTANATHVPPESRPQHPCPHLFTTMQLTVVLTTVDTTLVSTDGEVRLLRTPLDYCIHPQALRVIVP